MSSKLHFNVTFSRLCSHLSVIVLFLCLVSCKSTSRQGIWDQKSATFLVPDAGIEYHLPSPTENWAIAPGEDLPANIKFCGVETDTRVCVMLIALDGKEYGTGTIQNLTQESIDGFLDNVMRQPDMENIRVDSTSVTYNRIGTESYHFHRDTSFSDSVNNIKDLKITYSGCIFNANDGIYALLLTMPTETSNSAEKYLKTLSVNE